MSAYYIAKDGQQTGPFEVTAIQQQLQSGALRPSDLCWQPGMSQWEPLSSRVTTQVVEIASTPAPLTPATTKPDNTPIDLGPEPLFLYVPVWRLVLLSFITFGIYEVYWFYKNWKSIKRRFGMEISPFWRAFFSLFFCHALLNLMHDDAESNSVRPATFAATGLATVWVILAVIARILDRTHNETAGIIAMFIPAYLCLVPVQSYVNEVTRERSPGRPYYPWSTGHIIFLILGIIFFPLVLIGLFCNS